jgi:hypothetical protein
MMRLEDVNSTVEVEEEIRNKGTKLLLILCLSLEPEPINLVYYLLQNLTDFSSRGLIYCTVPSPGGLTSPKAL